MTPITFTLNGHSVSYDGDLERSLLSWLREDRDLCAVKDGCSGQGFCRTCTVEIDGAAKLACATPLKRVGGRSVTTLEGLPEPVRQVIGEAFVRHGAVQCGFCTPGFLARTRVLLQDNPDPSRAEVVKALRHHYCRCTGYHGIVDAVLDAAAILRGARPAPPPPSHAGVGGDRPKFDALAKALGESPFVDDLKVPGMLHGALCFSAHARAKVLAIDTAAAAAMPGVVAVLTGADVPGQRSTGLIVPDWPLMVLPGELTRCVGDVLAVVVAATEDQARAAAAVVDVRCEVLAPLTDPELALASDIRVHDGGNLLEQSVVRRGGDIEAALARSAFVTRGTYHTQRIEHAFLEPEACLAQPQDDGLLVHSPGQGVYVDRRQIASLLGLPEAKVRVVQVATGGAFGGKEDLSVQGHAALAAFLLQKPVKVKLTRDESILMHPKRHPIRMTYAVGCDAQGKLTAVQADMLGDTGAYASVGGKVLERAAGHATGAYHVPVVDVVSRAVYTNNPPCGAMRGFGANQATFALECCLDDLCAQGGFDRWQFRWDNALVEGLMTATGQVLEGGVGVRATLEAVKPAYDRAAVCGLACGIKNCGVGNGMSDGCRVLVEIAAPDRVVVHHGWTEMGQGVHTVAIQVLCQETGLDPDIVDVVVDTAYGAEAGMTTSSRATSLVGNALRDASAHLAADLKTGTLTDLVGRTYKGGWSFDLSTKPGAPGKVITHYSYSYATQLVEIDAEGEVARVVAAHDAGRIMNPALFRGQIEGSVHMGLGYALSEDLPLKDGRPVSTRLRDLGLIPLDRMPPVEVIGVEVPDPLGPYGAKGVGEIGLVPTAGAVANALRAFDGVPRTRLPLFPRKEPAA
ncbi:MAG TPA: selenium-dependent xanthine dehydrogenase [Candidatus Krumholzibacteria bacterium]|nr:selenium-dependent xanthine dehydrogenase [Candidatus Krumholzibacteria bacterium]